MSAYFRANIAAMAGYMPGEQPQENGIIKLNTNENPYGPSPQVYAALRKALNPSLRLYPEPQSDTLRLAAAKVYGVKPANILAGNGSDEILSILLRCFVGPRDRVAYPFPTYSLYDTLIAIQDGSRGAGRLSGGFFPAGVSRRAKSRVDFPVQSQCAVRHPGDAAGDRKTRAFALGTLGGGRGLCRLRC